MRRICGVLAAIVVFTFPQFLTAQTAITNGSLRGRVVDPSGAVIATARVALTEEATGTISTGMTDHEGSFLFPALKVGLYSLKVTAPGFRTSEVRGVAVQVGQTSSARISLQAGAITQSVDVTASTPILRSTESTLSTVISRSLVEDLPLSGRRYTDLALLTPNSSPDGQTGLVSFGGEQGGEDTGYANGNGANVFTVDGANATSGYFGNARGGERVPYVFGENSIQEFQVAISPYSAAYGGGATGFLNTVTKSGSDTFHGNAFYFNRNSGTGANDAVDKAAGIPRPVDVLQQFGGAVGGPTVHQRSWFFFDYEQQREKNPISVINTDYQGVSQTDFGVPGGVSLPSANGSLPVPGSISSPDPTNPVYLQQVANALKAIHSNLGTHSRYRNDLALFSKFDYQPGTRDRLYLSLNLNRFNSPNGEITATSTPLFGISTLAGSFVRDYQASVGWTHIFTGSLLNDFHASFSRGDQYSTPTGLVDPGLPSILLSSPSDFELGNAGFAGGRTNEAQWELADGIDYVHGKHHFKFGAEGNHTHVTDLSFGGFDPDAQRQNGTLAGTYAFSSFSNFALGIYDSFSQAAGNPKFSFNVPYVGFYAQDTYQIFPHLTLDFGLREDFQVYPQPRENPAVPLTGQFPNQYQRLAPRFGFAWQPAEKTVVRGGFGMFYENFNGLNYRNAVVTNGLLSQQSSVAIDYDGSLQPNQQIPAFPSKVNDPALFSSPNISLVDPHFRFPYVLQSSLQIEREILPETTLSLGAMWTHGVHLIAGSAYDLNLQPPTGTTTYIVCPDGTTKEPCSGRQVVLPNLDTGLQQEGRINPNVGQMNALISPGINNYISFFTQLQRHFRQGVGVQVSYTFAKNITSNGVDFNNQFDFRNTHSPSLLDQRHRLTIAALYQPFSGRHFNSKLADGLLSNWTMSAVMLFSSGRPYAALLDDACTSSTGDLTLDNPCDNVGPGGPGTGNGNQTINDTAANQSTSNSALGINGSGPSPNEGINSFYGPWTQEVDMGLARTFTVGEHKAFTIQAQVFNLANHANYYVQNGNGVNQVQYSPVGSNCGDGATQTQTCYLVPGAGFKTLQVINALNGPRVLQFAVKYRF
jgi:Carboxypeptidase regulatory-like domain/TonB dependent receptor